MGKGHEHVSLTLKVAICTCDSKLLAKAMRSYPEVEELKTKIVRCRDLNSLNQPAEHGTCSNTGLELESHHPK